MRWEVLFDQTALLACEFDGANHCGSHAHHCHEAKLGVFNHCDRSFVGGETKQRLDVRRGRCGEQGEERRGEERRGEERRGEERRGEERRGEERRGEERRGEERRGEERGGEGRGGEGLEGRIDGRRDRRDRGGEREG